MTIVKKARKIIDAATGTNAWTKAVDALSWSESFGANIWGTPGAMYSGKLDESGAAIPQSPLAGLGISL